MPGEKAWRYKTRRWAPPPSSEGVQCATGEERRAITNTSGKTEVAGPKQEWSSAVSVFDGKSKVWCCKEQYCIGIWNIRSMNQGKLDMVKQEMARLNIDILGISELKWTGMGKFSSDDHHIYHCGQEPLRRNGIALIVNKSLKCSTWLQSQKWQNDLGSRKTIEHHSNVLTINVKEAEADQFYEDLQDLLELILKKEMSCSSFVAVVQIMSYLLQNSDLNWRK